MVLLKRASPTATRFYEYVLSDAARAIFRKHGYAVPQ
jgi:ABC-type molybdate transport system substrate-binding protein